MCRQDGQSKSWSEPHAYTTAVPAGPVVPEKLGRPRVDVGAVAGLIEGPQYAHETDRCAVDSLAGASSGRDLVWRVPCRDRPLQV
jgi:hypothetical protein